MKSLDLRQFAKNEKRTLQFKSGSLTGLLNKEIRLFPKKFDDRRKQNFFMELHSMISSGVNLKHAIEIMIAQESETLFKSKLQIIEDHIIQGNSLSDSLKLSGLFSSYECVTIKTGEETGRINDVVLALSSYYAARIRQRRQVIAAISYPAVILAFSFMVVVFLLLVMIPMFQSVFSKFNSELPASTKAVFLVSQVLRDVWPEMLVTAAGLILLYSRIRNRSGVRRFKAKLIDNLPFFGVIHRGIAIAGFCRSMGFLISSKIPLNRCLELQHELCTYAPIQNALAKIEKDLINGRPLHECFTHVSEFNIKLISMIRIGEEINQLDKFFDTLAEQYTGETDFRIAQMNALLEPFLIVFLGLVVGFILITMYLPMFQISSSLSQ